MKQKSETGQTVASGVITDMRLATPQRYSAEEKILVMFDNLFFWANRKRHRPFQPSARCHESIDNLTQADVYSGLRQAISKQRGGIKRETMQQ